MKHNFRRSLFLLLAATLGLAQKTVPSPVGPKAATADSAGRLAFVATSSVPSAKSLALGIKSVAAATRFFASGAKPFGDDLQGVLTQMNQTAEGFTSAQGDFEYKIYQKVVDDLLVQKGHIYFHRTKKGVDAALRFTSPDDKQVVFKNGRLRWYEPKINQITEPDVSKNRASVESFLSLGFGAPGDDLLKDYDVTMEGWENIDGVKTAKLGLVAKNEKLRNTYNKIVLWIDPVRDVMLQQQFFEAAGNYRLTRYTNLKINGNLPRDAFDLKTGSNPKTVHPM